MEGEEEAGGVEAEESEQERAICAPQFIGRLLGEVRERVRMKSGGVYIPSSIDVRPMGKKGTNAYAQMGLQSPTQTALSSDLVKAASSCS